MSWRQKDPLRPLSDAERLSLSWLSRSRSAPAAQVARARAVLAVADGQSYAMAAELVGRATGDTVARWVAAFNRDGLVAVKPRHGGGHSVRYGEAEQRRILAEAGRVPERARDGTATWSLTALRDAPRRSWPARRQHLHDRPRVACGRVQLAEGAELVRDRRGRAPAQARRPGHRRRSGCRGKKGLIERAYTLGGALGLEVWREDEAGPSCRSRAAAGDRKATRRPGRTSMSGVAPARS